LLNCENKKKLFLTSLNSSYNIKAEKCSLF